MQKDRKIMLYADINGTDLTYDNFVHALANLEQIGEICGAKIYNAQERKHRQILMEVANRGFEVAPPQRIKSIKKGFDYRMIVDIMEDVLQNTNIDSVALIAPPADLVYFFGRLRSYNIFIISLDNNDEETRALTSEFLDIGRVEKLEPLKQPKTPKAKPQIETEIKEKVDLTQELMEEKLDVITKSVNTINDDESTELLEEIQKLLDEFRN